MEQELFLTRIQYFSTGLILGISMLHFILYYYWRKQKTNLFYALFLLFLSVTIFSDFQQLQTQGLFSAVYLKVQRGALALSLITGHLFFYKLFRDRLSWHFWLFSIVLLFAGGLAVFQPLDNFILLEAAVILVLLDIIRITYLALRTRSEQLWIVGVGFIIFTLFASYDLLLDLDVITGISGLGNAYQFGIMGLIVSTSVYLAKDFSNTHQKVVEQEKNILQQKMKEELLQEEVARTSKELEEARELQLSMLPARMPEMDSYRFAADMRTAVEVGGDYYDFNKSGNNHLTLVIGDATGHGNKAGFMVSIIKSLFKSYQPSFEFPAFFNKVTKILKQMNLGSLYMALTCVNIRDNELTISAAGMPPAILFRSSSGIIEEIVLKGMPLGAFSNFPYKQTRIELYPGDTVLLISDGLDELFNQKREMFGWDRVKSSFQNYARLQPDQVISKMNEEADKWRGDKPIDDDMTFLVLKYTGG